MASEQDAFTVVFQPIGRRATVKGGTSLLEAAQAAGVVIWSVCGGKGTCGKCKIILRGGGAVTPKVAHRFLSERDLEEGYCLACQTKVEGDMEVVIPPESRLEGEQILSRSRLALDTLNPAALKLTIDTAALRGGVLGSEDRILREAAREADIPSLYLDDATRMELRRLLGAGTDKVTLLIDRGEARPVVSGVEPGETAGRSFGLAVDLGTTTIVVYLVDLRTGKILATASDYNDQIAYGEDLLSRVDFAARDTSGLAKLQEATVETINRLNEKIASRSGVKLEEIIDICVAGNTVMIYLLTGQNPVHLLKTNAPVSRDPILLAAQSVGVRVRPQTHLFCLPSVSRYVGGDAVGDILASGLFKSPDVSVLIDMGTNGEVILGGRGWVFSTSCASGPAFEGWEIKFGMRAVAGAIDHLKIDRGSLRTQYTVIGGEQRKPVGICGSGLIDAVAEMLLSGVLDSLGRIQTHLNTPFIRVGGEGAEYIIASAGETAFGREIVITQRDVENFLQSKAAVCAAVSVLMKKMRISIDDVRHLYLAGAFGNYVDPKSAVTAGVFPEFPRAEVVQLGNGAVAGAYLALLSMERRREATEIARVMTYFDLSADADFMEEFNAALSLPGNPELLSSFYEGSGYAKRKIGY